MDKVLKFFQILNQIVWILVGLATLYSIWWFITQNPISQLTKSFQNPSSAQNLESNPQIQNLIQQYLKEPKN